MKGICKNSMIMSKRVDHTGKPNRAAKPLHTPEIFLLVKSLNQRDDV
jgi:hypothetical protein